jgi:hypothetical protein
MLLYLVQYEHKSLPSHNWDGLQSEQSGFSRSLAVILAKAKLACWLSVG